MEHKYNDFVPLAKALHRIIRRTVPITVYRAYSTILATPRDDPRLLMVPTNQYLHRVWEDHKKQVTRFGNERQQGRYAPRSGYDPASDVGEDAREG